MSKLKDKWTALMKKLGPQPIQPFIPDVWAKEMMDKMKDNITLMGVAMARMAEPEPVCPITKALIVQQLSDLCVKHPGVSIREIINVALQDGVKDDYELARKLEGVSVILNKRKSGEHIRLRVDRFHKKVMAPAVKQLESTINQHVLDSLIYGQAAMKITRDQSADCAGPEDKTGSGGG